MLIFMLFSSVNSEQILTTPLGLTSLVLTFFLAALAILVVPNEDNRYYAWLTWSLLALICALNLLNAGKELDNEPARQVLWIAFILIYIAFFTAIATSLKKFAPKASRKLKIGATLTAIAIPSILLSRSLLTKPDSLVIREAQHPCDGIVHAQALFDSERYPEAIELLRKIIANDAQCVEGRVLLVRAYVRLPEPQCESAQQHFFFLPPEKKTEVADEFATCNKYH